MMHEVEIQPRFSETDAMTHIGNTVLPVWFEEARAPLTRILHPSMSIEDWPFILAHIDVDYLRQIFVNEPVTIKVGISKIGNSSYNVYHEAWQSGELAASGNAVVVNFDFKTKTSKPLNSEQRSALEAHLIKS